MFITVGKTLEAQEPERGHPVSVNLLPTVCVSSGIPGDNFHLLLPTASSVGQEKPAAQPGFSRRRQGWRGRGGGDFGNLQVEIAGCDKTYGYASLNYRKHRATRELLRVASAR